MNPVDIATIGAVVGVALTAIGLWLIVRKPGHRHTWTDWQVRSYSGSRRHWRTGEKDVILIREQERHCTGCGYSQVEELP